METRIKCGYDGHEQTPFNTTKFKDKNTEWIVVECPQCKADREALQDKLILAEQVIEHYKFEAGE